MAVNMANAFTDEKIHNVLVCARATGPLKKFIPVDTGYYELNKSSFFDFSAFVDLIRIIKKEKPNILHAHSSSIYWGVAVKFLRPSVKLIWHDHYGLSESLKETDRKLLKFLSPWINGIVAVNEILEQWSLRNMRTKQVIYLRNFPYLKILKSSFDSEKSIILHLANLRTQKDHYTLVEAIRILKERRLVSFEVWCAGTDNGDSYSTSVKNLVKTYNLENEIKFIGANEDVNLLLEKASIGVLSSKSEGLPVSLLEYGLAGLPVAVTAVGQCSEVLDNGRCGLLVPHSSPEKLAESIEQLLENRIESENLGILFRSRIEQIYGSKSFMCKYLIFVEN